MYIPHHANTLICMLLIIVMVDSIRGRKDQDLAEMIDEGLKQLPARKQKLLMTAHKCF